MDTSYFYMAPTCAGTGYRGSDFSWPIIYSDLLKFVPDHRGSDIN